jgi:prepilin-type processing-associated H-X9-DG protein
LATGSYALVSGDVRPGTGQQYKFLNTGVFMYWRTFTTAEIRDGLSNTMFVGEVIDTHTSPSPCAWTYAARYWTLRSTANPLNTPPGTGLYLVPDAAGDSNAAFNSRHPGGANFAFGDGHADFIQDSIDLATYQALSTRDGSETIKPY